MENKPLMSIKDKIQTQLWAHIEDTHLRSYRGARDYVKAVTDPSVWSTVWGKVRIKVRSKVGPVVDAIENQIYYGEESDDVFP